MLTIFMIRSLKVTFFLIFFSLFSNIGLTQDLQSKLENKIYSKINEFTENIGSSLADSFKDYENLKYLDFSIDLQEHLEPTIEIQSVNELVGLSDGTIFNQINLLSHDKETTINFGIGKRKLFDNDTLMLGSNIFLDYQFDESHLRSGIGFEAVSSTLDLIANYYNAHSGFKATDSGREKALDGYDVQFNFHLKKNNKKETDIFFQTFEWKNPNSNYKVDGQKIGLTSKIGNLSLEIGYLDDNKNNDGIFGSAKVVVPLGENKTKTNNINSKQLNSVRNKLYMPVKRENKIKVVKISKSGVKISGF